jgi:putative nucleotidyltransferase with HDIG domain
MTLNILKLANSVQFGASRNIDSISTAIALLGINRLFQVVVAQRAAKLLKNKMVGYDLVPKELLRHSVWTALAAEEFSRQLHLRTPDLLFTAGLLHDVGKVVLDPYVAKMKVQLDEESNVGTTTYQDVERAVLGFSHADIGAMLMQRWHFPKELEAMVRLHHDPVSAGDYFEVTMVVHLADMLAYSSGVGTGIDGLKYRVCEDTKLLRGLTGRTIERVASQTLDKMTELEEVLSQMV